MYTPRWSVWPTSISVESTRSLVDLLPKTPCFPREFLGVSKSVSKSANSHFSAPLRAGSTSQTAQFIVDGGCVGHDFTLGSRITEKKNEKRRYYGRFGGGSAYFNASVRMHFFQASACGRDMSRDSEFVENRAKTTRKMPSAEKSTCISVTILTCFQTDNRMHRLQWAEGIRGFPYFSPV